VDEKLFEILTYPNDILRKPTEAITTFGPYLEDLAGKMFHTMLAAKGIGLAGPQVGVSQKIIVINTRSLDPEKGFTGVMINPEIIHSSSVLNSYAEGCLSFPNLSQEVERPKFIVVKYQNVFGEKFAEMYDGVTATCIQHEVDHINQKLFIDYNKGDT
jgi:peptide deformylase